MAICAESATSAPKVVGRPFQAGNDPRRGRGPAPGTRPPRAAVEKKADQLAADALERMRQQVAEMGGRTLAEFAATPALRYLLDIVADESKPDSTRINAAGKLLEQGWVKAPSANLNMNADVPSEAVVYTADDMRRALADAVRSDPTLLEHKA
jgi:hypothetical protein